MNFLPLDSGPEIAEFLRTFPGEVSSGDSVAGPGVRDANAAEEPGVHGNCDIDAGAGNRREHGDFQRGERGAAAPAALSRAWRVGPRLHGIAYAAAFSDSRRRLLRLPRADQGVRQLGTLCGTRPGSDGK